MTLDEARRGRPDGRACGTALHQRVIQRRGTALAHPAAVLAAAAAGRAGEAGGASQWSLRRRVLARDLHAVAGVYFGSVGNNPAHRAVVIAGDCIDLRDDLDAGAIGKNGAAPTHTISDDKQASPDLVAAALAVIPNDDTPDTHAFWEKIGIAPDDRASRAYWVKVCHATKAAAG